ncbi:hypothetical protein BKA64DRAFT_705576 [Cadophora sp. MPI-SDFR-AT-0126]|nr:hypothetical protein BKA64DRAFT_705576 [Leotiomycetes sp. MPI-SDFR-AT-0126]
MKFSTLLVIPFLGVTLVAAVPAPLEVTVELEAEVSNSTEAVLEKRIANTMCERFISPGRIYQYTVWTAGWGNNDETSRSGCGTGLLDNLRGQCGGSSSVNSWKCYEVHENPHDTMMTFSFNNWNQATAGGSKCIEDAIWLASPGWKKEYNVKCKHLNS